MTESDLTPSQKAILQKVVARFEAGRVDRLWLFPPRVVAGKESGLFVLSTFEEEGRAGGQRTLHTCRYEAEPVRGGMRQEERFTEEGSAPVARIERVIAGVLVRSGADEAEPVVEEVAGDAGRWSECLVRYGLATPLSIS
jgi:hypothetical protein